MQLRRQSNGQIITLLPGSLLGTGGEARVYSLAQESQLVAKIYHQPDPIRIQKLAAMIANPPEVAEAGREVQSIAWPLDLLVTANNEQRVVGFLMPRVAAMRSVADFYNPRTRRQFNPLFNYFYLHRAARNLAIAVRSLHERGYVVGDINESNILISETALVTLVDADSFQVPDRQNQLVFRCAVGKLEYTPPEMQHRSFAEIDRLPEHDLFGLAVIIFQLLMEGTHPFAGQYQGNCEPPPIKERIAAGHFVYGTKPIPYQPAAISLPFKMLNPGLQSLFIRCFEEGHEEPQARPTASAWQVALAEAEMTLRTCRTNEQHRFGNHLANCPWCERTRLLQGRDPFPSLKVVQAGKHLYTSPLYNSPTDSKHETPKTSPVLPSFQPHPGNRIPKYFHVIVGVVIILLFIILANFVLGSLHRTSRFADIPAKTSGKMPINRPPETKLPVNLTKSVDEIIKEINLSLVWIPEGKLAINSKVDNNGVVIQQTSIEKVPEFYINKYEVTQEQWLAVSTLPKVSMDLDPRPSRFLGNDLPVEHVTRDEVGEFCMRLSRYTKRTYRLPTELEWEYACRAGISSENVKNLDDMAWYAENAKGQTHGVGQKQPNMWGLYDMYGNVAEWCQGYYKVGADQKAYILSGYSSVNRGGSYDSLQMVCQPSYRVLDDAAFRQDIGFRLAMPSVR